MSRTAARSPTISPSAAPAPMPAAIFADADQRRGGAMAALPSATVDPLVGDAVASDESGCIVLASRLEREVDERPGLDVRRGVGHQDLADPRLVDRVGQAVGADEHAVIVDELKPLE